MDWWYVLLKGALQGFAEFLPISSSAHLVLFDVLAHEFGWLPVPLNPYLVEFFDILLHLGTLLAVGLYFRKELLLLLPYLKHLCPLKGESRCPLKTLLPCPNGDSETLKQATVTFGNGTVWQPVALIRSLAITFVVTSVLVLSVNKGSAWVMQAFGWATPTMHDLTQFYMQTPLAVAANLFILGGLLWFSEEWSKRHQPQRDAAFAPSIQQGAWLGVAQACAASFRGISRSGSTMATALLNGFSRKEAATFSFLMSLPILLAAFGYEFLKLLLDSGLMLSTVPWAKMLVGVVASGVVGYVGIAWLMKLIAKHSLKWFAAYVWLLALGLTLYFTSPLARHFLP